MADLPEFKRYLVRANTHVAEICAKLAQQDFLGMDTETTSLDPWEGRLRLLQVSSWDLKETYIFDFDYVTDIEPLRLLLLNPQPLKIFHNAAFDTKFILVHLSEGRRKVYPESILDTMLGDQLLTPLNTKRLRGYHSLGQVAARYANLVVDKDEQKSDWSGALSESQVEYACTDVEVLFPIAMEMSERIEREGMANGWRIENRCVLATAMMEVMGVDIDLTELKALEDEIDAKMAVLESHIAEYIPKPQRGLFGDEPINLRSPKQMKPALKDVFVSALASMNRKQAADAGFTRQWNEVRNSQFTALAMHKFEGERSDRPCAACARSKLNPLHIDSKSAEVIKNYRPLNPRLIDMLVDYSTLAQSYTTYCLGIPERRHKRTGKFHTSLYQLGQPQHRYMSKEPNLLNIPKTLKYGPDAPEGSIRYSTRSFRNCFKAPEGRRLIISDYDSLQLRLTAARARDRRMIEVIKHDVAKTGPDPHTIAAMLVSGKPAEQINKTDRAGGKVLNFATIFGAGPQRLQDQMLDMFGIVLSFEQCVDMRAKYLANYADLARYHDEQRRRAERECRIEVKGGGVVLLQPGERQINTVSLNFPAVLTEQLGIKEAMGDLARLLIKNEEDAWVSFYVYDELHINASASSAERLAPLMDRHMQASMQRYCECDEVQITAKAQVVRSWDEKK